MNANQQQTLLVVTWEGGGNIPPVMCACKSLIAAGYRIYVLTEPCLTVPFEALGAEVLCFSKHFTRVSREQDLLKDANAKPWELPVFDSVIVGPIESVIDDTLKAIDQVKPTAVLADCLMIGSLFAAEARHLPRVVLFHMPEFLPGANRPPGGFGLSPGKGFPGKVRDKILGQLFFKKTGQYLPAINKARTRIGLGHLANVAQVFHEADLRLIQTARAFDIPIEPAPSNVRYTGPVLDDPDWVTDYALPFENNDRPLILVSLSTTYQDQALTLQNIIKALADLPVNALVTLGPAMADLKFKPPAHVYLTVGVPHSMVLPHAALVVTHAGHGTLIKALGFGVPVLALPMGRDQNDNAQRLVEHGAGLKCSPKANSRSIRKALNLILSDASYRIQAQNLGERIIGQGQNEESDLVLEVTRLVQDTRRA